MHPPYSACGTLPPRGRFHKKHSELQIHGGRGKGANIPAELEAGACVPAQFRVAVRPEERPRTASTLAPESFLKRRGLLPRMSPPTLQGPRPPRSAPRACSGAQGTLPPPPPARARRYPGNAGRETDTAAVKQRAAAKPGDCAAAEPARAPAAQCERAPARGLQAGLSVTPV